MAPTTPKPTRKTLLTTRVPATLANICHSVKVLLDFLFDGQEAAAKSGSAPAPGPQHQTTPQAPAPQQPNGTAADNELTVLGTDSRTSQDVPVSLSLDERLQSVYAIGANGTGKSTLLLNMVLSDIQQNRGLCLIEPHGDLTRQVIAAMAGERLKDVVYLDLKDSTASFSLNLFEVEPGADVTEIAKVASFVMHLFETVWNVGTETPRLQTVIRNITRVLIENPGIGTFSEIPLLLWEDVAREKLVRRVTNTQTKLFWSQYNKKTPRDREELIASTINKVDAYLNEPLIARIVSQSASTINFRRIMDEGKILLVHLSPQLEEPSRLLGAAILGRLLMASFGRSDTPIKKRRPFMLYADEYQRFATTDFATFLAEARKAKVGTTIANQVLEQLSDLNRATALQAGTVVVMRVSGEDSKILAPTFDTTPTNTIVGEEAIRAPVADPISYLTRHGHPDKTVATFVSDYLMPLTSLLKSASSSGRLVSLAWAFVLPELLHEGYRQLNECMARCMREGTASLDIPGLALFVLSGAYAADLTYIFFHHKIKRLGYVPLIGLSSGANTVGRADFLTSETKAMDFLRHCAKTSIFESRATVAWRVAAFLRMLKALRATLAVLANDPLMTDTGLFQPKYQLRTYQDQENLVANTISQLPNYTAKVRLLSGENDIKTNPPPLLVSEEEVEERIRAIKERMLREGYTKPAAAIEEEVRKRHEALRQRPRMTILRPHRTLADVYAANNRAVYRLPSQSLNWSFLCTWVRNISSHCAGELPLRKKGGACRVSTYKVIVFVPAFYPIEAKDEAEALEKVGEFYKGLYKKDFRELVEPLPEPEDVAQLVYQPFITSVVDGSRQTSLSRK